MQIVVGKFYKDLEDRTLYIFDSDTIEGQEIFWAFWHEQMLEEPNHGAIPFIGDGRLCELPFNGRPMRVTDRVKLVRECSEIEQHQYRKQMEGQ